MSKKGYLTAAEYKTLRQLLGFSQAEAAEFHKVQNLSTIKRWERGYSRVSEIACDKICDLLKKINWSINQALEKISELPSEDAEITLIVYPNSCYKQMAIGMDGLPNSVHRAMIARLYNALKERGYTVGIVEFNPQDYFAYMAAHGYTDGQDTRSAWASDYRSRLLLN